MSWIAWFRFRILGHSEHSFNSSDENSGAWCLPRTLLINWYSSEERAGHSISNNICMTILLQRVAYFSQFVDILLIFGLPPNRICYIFYVFLFQINPAALWLLHKSQKILWGSKLLINMCTCVKAISLPGRCDTSARSRLKSSSKWLAEGAAAATVRVREATPAH